FRHLLIFRSVHQPTPTPPRHLPTLLRPPHLVDLLAELPQHLQLGQVTEHRRQVRPLLLAEVLRPLDYQVAPLEDERRLVLVRPAPSPPVLPPPLSAAGRVCVGARPSPAARKRV